MYFLEAPPTAVGPNTGFATVTVASPLVPFTVQASGGVLYEWMWIIDRINGFEIRCGSTNTTGQFEINMLKEYRLTVTEAGGCQRVVWGVIQPKP